MHHDVSKPVITRLRRIEGQVRGIQRMIEEGGAAPTILNAANEIAVAEFLAGRLGFAAIPSLVEATMDAAARRGIVREPDSVDEALTIDRTAREIAGALKSAVSAER
mgnify:CR=1 FL=1